MILGSLSFAKIPSDLTSRRKPFIAMMKTSEFCDLNDFPLRHDRTLDWTLFIKS